ncbi:MAG: ion transporter, partial [Gammaproteobacteria bacterium]|nr:ion transporter [Gammaproteobacteria bacterium]NIM74177.1 ion transporter [Gammaproteobacteria bacterium]NIO25631.1 ion transporter [Gammaproteobacteria bacterium]NIQ27749.1 ion transporter [Gammaproteobacteria bacterium]NIT92972.1 ion transporter [Gammaproteobacteria bacterium]
AIVTMTTVGYGDISPITPMGKMLAATVMVLGYSFIIVPTGIISAELTRSGRFESISTRACTTCSREGHDEDAA